MSAGPVGSASFLSDGSVGTGSGGGSGGGGTGSCGSGGGGSVDGGSVGGATGYGDRAGAPAVAGSGTQAMISWKPSVCRRIFWTLGF